MGEMVGWELQYIAVVITVGIALAVFYDAIRIMRRLITHNIFWLSVEDIFYWMIAGIITFLVCFMEDAGNIRWFAIAGEVLGAWMYHKTFSSFIVKYVSLILFFPAKIVKKALKNIKKSFKISNSDKNSD